jgi:thiol-disulfide isomerase/thioredoxin
LRLVIAFLPGLLFGLALAGCDRQKAAAPQGGAPQAANAVTAAAAPAEAYPTGRLDRSHAGTPAPDALFEDGDGEPVRLSVFRGRPLLVNMWATWCGPCVVEMPSLDALAAREGATLQILAVSQDSDDDARAKVSDFFRAHHFANLEPYLDRHMGLMTGLQLQELPTTILYDAEGREVWRMTGMADWQGARAASLLREANPG